MISLVYAGEKGTGIEIENLVELLDRPNTELSMRFSTKIQSTDKFYTDLNAFQASLIKHDSC